MVMALLEGVEAVGAQGEAIDDGRWGIRRRGDEWSR
jgi:hypothetical protein